MVLQAVARIEGSLAAQKEEQKQQASNEPAPFEPPSRELPEAIAAIQAIVAAARDSVSATLSGPVFEEALAPSRKCARVVREIAWGLRESGADGRICSLLESQVDAINAACDQVVASGLRDGVLQAFDRAARDIGAIAPSTIEPQAEAETVAVIHVVDFSPAPLEVSEEAQITAADDELFDTAIVAPEEPSLEVVTEPALLVEENQPVEMVAVTIEVDEAPEPVKAVHLTIVPEATPAPILEVEPAVPAIELAIEPEAETATSAPASLGASLIASGIIARPVSPRSDPLAPIRRMSQAEKVAFFS
jgi:hypothetical protein